MSKPRAFLFVIAAAVVLSAAVGGYAAFLADRPREPRSAAPVWTEVRWPFPLDQWGPGRAFQCKAAACGGEVNLFVRAKIGFCNCAIGVADDDDLDRVGDVGLIDGESSALGAGRPIGVHWMKGRSRGCVVGGRGALAKSVLSIAFNDRCDVIVATATVGSDERAAQEGAVLEFLNSDLVLGWAETTLGL
jgi:hypothetical protein